MDIFHNIQIILPDISFHKSAQKHYEYMILTRSVLHRTKTIIDNTVHDIPKCLAHQ